MQTTLLGLAIAFILALLAALIGPSFVDWNQFKPQFELEASRVLGTPVRVAGALDARLLPTPTLRLRQVSAGQPNDPGRFAADKLDVEFSLGSLMRGDWRASELGIDGLALNVGLDERGRLLGPSFSGSFNIGSLSIDRLNVTGKVGLYDAASRTTIALDDIAFSGEVRALAGSVRGEGQLAYNGERYPFRLSTGQTADGNGVRVRFGVEPGARPISAYIDGVLASIVDAPRFEGALSVVRTASLKAGPQGAVLQTPWRMTANVRAEPSSAKLEQIELAYGAEDSTFKLNGVADVRFGASPLLHAVLAGRQLDADRLLAKEGATSEPAAIVANLRELVAGLPQPPLPVQAEVGVDSITLGGRPVQNVGLDLSASEGAWRINRLELRAPGATQLTLSGATAGATGFTGAISIDSADPDLLVAWMQGRSGIVLRGQRNMRARGRFNVTADRVALDDMIADLGSGELRGAVGWAKSAGGGSRLETDLRAELIDLDATLALVRTAMTQNALPGEASVKLKASIAKWSGQDLKPFAASFDVTPKKFTVRDFSTATADGMSATGSGSFDHGDATGSVKAAASGVTAGQAAALLMPFAPELAGRINGLGESSRMQLALSGSLEKGPDGRNMARASFDIDGAGVKSIATISGAARVDAIRAIDADAISREPWTVEAKAEIGKDARLIGVLPFGDIIKTAAGAAPFRLELNGSGALRAPLMMKVRLSGEAIDAEADGSVAFWASDPVKPTADLTLAVRRANLAVLLGQPQPVDISLTSRLALEGDQIVLRDIDGRLGGSRVRGRLTFVRGNEAAVEGELGVDVLDLGAAFAGAIGANGSDRSAPLAPGLMRGWRALVSFQAVRGVLPGGVELRPVAGTIKANGEALSFEAISGRLGGGEVKADIDARPGLSGLGLDARISMSSVEGASLRYRGLAVPAGRASLQMTLASRGRSASALTGALSGAGSFTLNEVRIPALDPKAFDVALRAGDAGQPLDAANLKALLEPVLAGGFAIPSAQVAFVVSDGRLRVGATALDGEGARAVVSGGYDITADQADMRGSLVSTSLPGRPEILVLAHGTPDAPVKTLDLTSLSSWLAVRAIDRETRRLDAIERGEAPPLIAAPPPVPPAAKDAAVAPQVAPVPDLPLSDVPVPGVDPRRGAPAKPKAVAPRPPPQAAVAPPGDAQAAPALPPAIDVKPAPGPRQQAPKPRPPLVLTPSFSN